MNATVINSNTIVCDTPPLDKANSESGDMFYNISVTMDGDYISNSTSNFNYYEELTISSVTPSLGPLLGGTKSVITGSGFN